MGGRHQANLTDFEKSFFGDLELMRCLREFVEHESIVVLWGNNARWAPLYIHLAVRFLGNEDSVLDCEGCHARWQWLMNTKRAIKFKLINCMLRLTAQMIGMRAFPPDNVLRPHIRDIRAEMIQQAQAVAANPGIARGSRNDMMYRDRFNLNANDLELMRRELHAANKVPQTFEMSRAVYFRTLLEPYYVYAFMGLQASPRCFYVAESKAFAGKDAPIGGEAIGRSLSLAWFEADGPIGDGTRVVPVNRHSANLELTTCTVAGLLMAAGHFEPIVPGESARQQELRYEERFFDFDLVVFPRSQRILGDNGQGESNWMFELYGSVCVEEHYFDTVQPAQLTKLQIARLLIICGTELAADWKRLYMLNKDALVAKL